MIIQLDNGKTATAIKLKLGLNCDTRHGMENLGRQGNAHAGEEEMRGRDEERGGEYHKQAYCVSRYPVSYIMCCKFGPSHREESARDRTVLCVMGI